MEKARILVLAFVAVMAGLAAGQYSHPPDINDDGIVDILDFELVCNNWLWRASEIEGMVHIPAGEFEMGDHLKDGLAYELPVHLVRLDSFYMGRYEITNQQYCEYLNSAQSNGEIKILSNPDGYTVYSSSDDANSSRYYDKGPRSPLLHTPGGVFSIDPHQYDRDVSNDPVFDVSWYGAAAYCNWRSRQEGYEECYDPSTWECDYTKDGYRLPTEAEWEYAAHGGHHDPYHRYAWGDTISHNEANYRATRNEYDYDVSLSKLYHPDWDERPGTSPVGSFAANGYGLYDIHGNVAEWCNDRHGCAYYCESPYRNPTGPCSGVGRTLRGGSWRCDARECRITHRDGMQPGGEGLGVGPNKAGFRVVLGGSGFANPADINDDGIVDMSDVAAVCAAVGRENMVRIPSGEFQMGDHCTDEGGVDESPLHTVRLDAFHMSRYEITNQQYCDYLNHANSQGEISVSNEKIYWTGSEGGNEYLCCYIRHATNYSQIAYSGGMFYVSTECDRDMADDPVLDVSWYGAAVYCNWRSGQEGYEECYDPGSWVCDFSKKGYRLPTEAEWEYAARGGHSGWRFPWSDNISHDWANYYNCENDAYYMCVPVGFHPAWRGADYPYTAPVGSFVAVGYGLHDMIGNAAEWCNDWYDCDYYQDCPTDNPTGPDIGECRVLRGGSWINSAEHCRLTERDWRAPDDERSGAGFRVVLDLN